MSYKIDLGKSINAEEISCLKIGGIQSTLWLITDFSYFWLKCKPGTSSFFLASLHYVLTTRQSLANSTATQQLMFETYILALSSGLLQTVMPKTGSCKEWHCRQKHRFLPDLQRQPLNKLLVFILSRYCWMPD